jgi:hypothetical protein
MGVPTEPLMAFVGQAFNSANGDVRNAAVKVTTEVYRLMGAPVEKYLKNVKPLVREVNFVTIPLLLTRVILQTR